jgi:2,4-dienoyl-CoA reductase-like NADH-dependent reductase (Old Yellow Enzyme family)
MPTLFDPLQLGDIQMPNRIVMAPLTRLRADSDHLPNDLMATYYSQRASAGLIITEGVPVSSQGVGYANASGIWSEDQADGWKRVTSAVKDRGGRIFMQLWHVGRISDPSLLGGDLPVGPSAIAAKGHVSRLRPERPFPIPRALGEAEMSDLVESFRRGAQNAQDAGFDGSFTGPTAICSTNSCRKARTSGRTATAAPS